MPLYIPPRALYTILTHILIYSLVRVLIEVKQMIKNDLIACKDGHGNDRVKCRNSECGGFGDAWGSLKGFCTSCKHAANVGCKCTLYDCGKKYWAMTSQARRRVNAKYMVKA
jgi:hypothetical protein